ncbi:pyruvate, water dikinase regulatory protein [Pokkaliibacter sp. CJK22405]|uniref:posphoenolpyruvate synthetase regulatory kinase/phosphorylase PpsR n=1 Tax=Pokkaliibacter sp. CJK22405 TaxID=3384615 RepID=UPI00398486CB
MKRTAFFISDGTGITAEALGHSLLSQFKSIEFEQVTLPYIDTLEKAATVVKRINAQAITDGERPLVFDTLVDKGIREVLMQANAFTIDIFSTYLNPLEQELGTPSSYHIGQSHGIKEEKRYKARIEAVNFALEQDDGLKSYGYKDADLILVGVSRCGKTPTCLYLALQFGVKAANYPLTEEDFPEHGRLQLPQALQPYRHKLYALTIDPHQLADIRHERRPGSQYSTFEQCDFELREAQQLFTRERIPTIDTTKLSVEEISTRIMETASLKRLGS